MHHVMAVIHDFLNFCRSCRLEIFIVLIFTTFFFSWCLLIAFEADGKSTRNLVQRRHRDSLHKLGVIVPFRDRFDELLEFIPHMQLFLNNQSVWHQIYIVNQVDDYRFNRASLINAGFLFSTSGAESCDYIAMHDVDLLPLNQQLRYSFPTSGPVHLAAPHLHPKYHYQTFVGGILLILKDHFVQVNGMSNRYWGWGLEDDEFYVRLKQGGLTIHRPGNLSTGINNTFRHSHNSRRKRDHIKCFNQYENTRKRDRATGLNTLKYSLISTHSLLMDNLAPVTVLNVQLFCDEKLTPWCRCPDKKPATQARKGSIEGKSSRIEPKAR
ncbi:beta-1,4-galactosyltransferase 7-like isoform X2 [Bemisia tabaci]|uniref:beta-1,4-galactosyltransferase 7 isoform X2 n=1 Tax=Bemisia tabaci TaxID=7038 RepID=UPI003B288F37